MTYSYEQHPHSRDVHTILLQQIDDEKQEGSCFQFDCPTEVVIEVYEKRDFCFIYRNTTNLQIQ